MSEQEGKKEPRIPGDWGKPRDVVSWGKGIA